MHKCEELRGAGRVSRWSAPEPVAAELSQTRHPESHSTSLGDPVSSRRPGRGALLSFARDRHGQPCSRSTGGAGRRARLSHRLPTFSHFEKARTKRQDKHESSDETMSLERPHERSFPLPSGSLYPPPTPADSPLRPRNATRGQAGAAGALCTRALWVRNASAGSAHT